MESQQILCEIFIFLPEFYSTFLCFFGCGLFLWFSSYFEGGFIAFLVKKRIFQKIKYFFEKPLDF